jgi:hypothetical protein
MLPVETVMTKPDLANALVPHLIAALPDPFRPDESSAKRVLETAANWADLLHSEANKDKKLVMFMLG